MRQASNDLGLERINLHPDIHCSQAAILPRQAGDREARMDHVSTWVVIRTALARARDEARDDRSHVSELLGGRSDELTVVVEHARHALLGNVQAANIGKGKRRPLAHHRVQLLQPLGVHGRCSRGLVGGSGKEDT
jgi:hypothetical protein